jgi:hypothetical protein
MNSPRCRLKEDTISFPTEVYLLLEVLISDWKRGKEKAAFL